MDFDYILKRLKFDKKVGIVLFYGSFFLLYQVLNNFHDTPNRIIYFLSFVLMFCCGVTVYLDCRYIYPPVYSVFKVDMIIYELNLITNYKINENQCFSIIYQFNEDCKNKIIPVLVEVPQEDKEGFVKRLVTDRFHNQSRMVKTLTRNREFISENERKIIREYFDKLD